MLVIQTVRRDYAVGELDFCFAVMLYSKYNLIALVLNCVGQLYFWLYLDIAICKQPLHVDTDRNYFL